MPSMGRKEQDERARGGKERNGFNVKGYEKVPEQTIHVHTTYERKRNWKIMRRRRVHKLGRKQRFSPRKKR